ncbi:XRE family transcriptional regulator [Actinomadura rupiterrae]|uniref:XRE family transcriptional regulator n=1 Tax=Actinomadura rupiterrae TaxID=559627 RepID=UPI0020A2C66B|nr:XRE family transcriptional regulator [Actinomadura rupiterrae]MCP2337602.1 Zn-dependent peptidase ImmA (M78 family)/transcriptional regulator with XRE-family HTH domain [Actinomadura rupiterrae]
MNDEERIATRHPRVVFDGERLTLARRLRGLRKNQLAQAVGTTPATIGQYEAGVHRPSGRSLSRLAIALGVPVDFFRPGRGPVSPDAAHFRSLRSTTQVERDQALAYGRIAADLVAVLAEVVEFPAAALPEHPVSPDEIAGPGPVAAAREARAAMASGAAGAVPHVVRLLERHGVLVLVMPPSSERVDAFGIGAHPHPMVLFNPAKGDYWRNRFDAAHELGHLVMHADAEPGSKIVEDQAHRFAAEFLMPGPAIADVLPAVPDWDRLAALKAEWGVSIAALLYRARTLGVMPEQVYREAMATMSRQGWRRAEPGPSGGTRPLERPTLLTRAIELAAAGGLDRDALADRARVTRADLDLLVPPR